MTEETPSWLQRNAFLVAAAGLPVLVVVFFLAATRIPEWTVADPVHDPVFALVHYNRSAGYAIEFRAQGGRLNALARRNPENGYGTYHRLYRYHLDSGKMEEIAVDIPAEVIQRLEEAPLVAGKTPPAEEFDPAVLEGVALSTSPVAPDGYTFEHEHASGRGLFGELFGMGRGRNRMGLAKGGRFVPIIPEAGTSHYAYSSAFFLAWVEETR